MRRYENQERTATYKVCVERKCDLCGADLPKDDFAEGPKFDKATIAREHGSNYGADGGHRTTQSFDVCSPCFVSKVVPWFAASGAKPQTSVSEW